MQPQTQQAGPIAYFSMEIGLQSDIPTYSGGLGVLAGDSLRAAADLGIPMVAITLLHRKGYFQQHLDGRGRQTETPAVWSPEQFLQLMEPHAGVSLEGRQVHLRAWRYTVRGVSGHTIPVYLLDTDLETNAPADRRLTDRLYGGDSDYRLSQEIILGIGGVAMLRALGHADFETYHMNEGHSAFLTLALLEERLNGGAGPPTDADFEAVRRQCVFTVHTPVAAGHDRFPEEVLSAALGANRLRLITQAPVFANGVFNLTHLAMFLSRSANAVSMRHGMVSNEMFPDYHVGAITNGADAGLWTAQPFAELFDRRFPAWRRDNRALRYATGVPLEEFAAAHDAAKEHLLTEVKRLASISLDPQAFTIGFARRATPYKRADLLFTDLARLRRITRRAGPLQIVYSGKAHPNDEGGHALIQKIFAAAAALKGVTPVVYLERYDMALAGKICAGVDLWLNTPQKPLEASGTSGMKASLNGVPSLSTLDGWWVEGHIEGVTGWSIGEDWRTASDSASDARALYDKLEHAILPMYYNRPLAYLAVRRNAIALNGSYFNAQRMMSQYRATVYSIPHEGASA